MHTLSRACDDTMSQSRSSRVRIPVYCERLLRVSYTLTVIVSLCVGTLVHVRLTGLDIQSCHLSSRNVVPVSAMGHPIFSEQYLSYVS